MATIADTDLIACVYPCYDEHVQDALKAIQLKDNKQRYVPGLEKPESRSNRRGRGSTEEPEPCGGSGLDDRTRLELRFSDGPKTPLGFVFGRDEACDIVLPNFPGVSSYHFALTFDDHDRIIVKDLGSLFGTQVTYNEDGKGWRRDFVWLVGGHKIPQQETSIVIHVNKHLKFQLVVSHHDMNPQLYKDNIDLFRQGTADTENLFDQLRFPLDTERATGTHTPGRGPVFLRKKLGEGSFGVVTHFWNVSNGEEYALKQPSSRAIREKEVDADLWKREADIMGRTSHEHIVRLLWKEEKPWPKLCLEYVPGGSLRDQEHISSEECKQALCQLLSALTYLHGLEPPIVHRDIKPDNILVQSRYAGSIYVKFGDFGISREGRESGHWKTICGTWKYAAPEILKIKEYYNSGGRMRKRYTAAVDIWSLGVVVFKLLCGLPRYKVEYEHQGPVWGEKIVKKLGEDLRKRPDEMLQFLSTKMLIMEPRMRDSAKECYDEALRLCGGSEAALQTTLPYPYVEGQQDTVRYDDPQTAIFRDTEVPPDHGWTEDDPIDTVQIERYITGSDDVADSMDPAEIQRYVRSNNPSQTSQRRRSGRISKASTAMHSRRIRHSQHAVESSPQREEDEVDLEIGHYYQNPVNSLCLGSSLSALGRELPSGWDQSLEKSLPRSELDSEPNIDAGGVRHAEDGIPGPGVGQPWPNFGRSWPPERRPWEAGESSRRGGGFHESQGQAVVQCSYDDNEEAAAAAALLLEIQKSKNDLGV